MGMQSSITRLVAGELGTDQVRTRLRLVATLQLEWLPITLGLLAS